MADSQRKTENLFDVTIEQGSISISGDIPADNRVRTREFINVESEYITLSWNSSQNTEAYIMMYDANGDYVSGVGWRTSPTTHQFLSTIKKIRIIWRYESQADISPSAITNVMLNSGSTPLPYEPYWQHSLRKLTTATEAVENPLYSDGTAITAYTLKGNTSTSGTPTPSNPITISGVGNKTANLFDYQDTTGINDNYYINQSAAIVSNSSYYISPPIKVSANTDYTWQFGGTNQHSAPTVGFYDNNDTIISAAQHINAVTYFTFTTPSNCAYVRASVYKTSKNESMLSKTDDVIPFEPYGYKIPISSVQTTPIYLGSVQSTRQIQKLVLAGNEESWSRSTSYSGGFFSSWSNFGGINYGAIYCSHAQYVSDITDYVSGTCYSDGSLNIRIMPEGSTVTQWREYLAQQYANGTPVTVWYVLQTATTGVVNEPLMKIGTYADTLSNATAIPTTEGANSITVDTTVQPSEFTATWTGWHDSSVKEYDGSDWQ